MAQRWSVPEFNPRFHPSKKKKISKRDLVATLVGSPSWGHSGLGKGGCREHISDQRGPEECDVCLIDKKKGMKRGEWTLGAGSSRAGGSDQMESLELSADPGELRSQAHSELQRSSGVAMILDSQPQFAAHSWPEAGGQHEGRAEQRFHEYYDQ